MTYDPARVSYEALLKVLFGLHEASVGAGQYRSAVFYHDESQRKAAEAYLQGPAKGAATRLEPAATFWRAEEYHQRYYEKQGIAACRP